MRQLAVTRPAEQLSSLIAEGRSRGIEVIPIPLTSIHNLSYEWPDDCDIDTIDWVFFTSANGVTAFLSRLNALGLVLPGKTRYAAVGEKTAEALQEYGLSAAFTPSESYGRTLFEEWIRLNSESGQVVVYARGKQVNYDPSPILAEHLVTYVPIVCYETGPRAIANDAIECLSAADSILFTAPSAVNAYAQRFGRPLARPIAIGRTTAARMDQFGWPGIVTMKQSNIDTILEYI